MNKIALIGSKGSGKNTFINIFAGDNRVFSNENHLMAIWTLNIQNNEFLIYEMENETLNQNVSVLNTCTGFIIIIDTPTMEFDNDKEIISFLINKYPSRSFLIILNKIDQIFNNQIDLSFFEWLTNLKSDNIQIMETSLAYKLDVPKIQKWFTQLKPVIDVNNLDLVFYKLGKNGPKNICFQFDKISFGSEEKNIEFLEEFMINTSIQLTQGEAYSKGIFITPAGRVNSFRAINMVWRMKDPSPEKDERLNEGLFFLSIFLPSDSPLFSIPYYELDVYFSKLSFDEQKGSKEFVYSLLNDFFSQLI